MNATLYNLSNEFIAPGIERIRCENFHTTQDAVNYLYHILKTGDEWIINLDEDAFIVDWNAITDIIKFMSENQYLYAGMPDGGVCWHRKNSWIVCNPFFNIFNAKAIKPILPDLEIIRHSAYSSHMDQYKPGFVKGNYQNGNIEPFNSMFYWLMSHSKGLYLNGKDHTDKLSTILIWKEKSFIYHSWYGREFESDPVERSRIIRLYNEAKQHIERT